jgi:hypothetical protein
MDGKIYSLVSRSGCQLPRPLLTTVCTSVSEAVYLFTCGKYLVDAEQFLRSGSLTGKPVYWGRTSCTLSVSRLVTSRSTQPWIVRSTFYPAEQVDLAIETSRSNFSVTSRSKLYVTSISENLAVIFR